MIAIFLTMRRKPLLVFLMLCLAGHICTGQTIPAELYKASTIPEALKTNANAVVRYSDNIINIKGPGKALIKVHKIVTALNEKAKQEAVMVMGYNRKYDEYSDIEMRIYNENGDLLKKYHKSDMYDGSAADNETMVTNQRFLAMKHDVASYPVTIEMRYEESVSSFISLDNWRIQENLQQAVQNAKCVVTVDPAMGFRYKTDHSGIQPTKENKDGHDIYTWEVKDLPAVKKEDNVLAWTLLPEVLFAVNSFNCYGYPGDLSSWQNFGKWILSLNTDVTLSPQRITEVQNMTKDLPTDKEKARFLYNYMQKSMRYVSIQLGIGGFKPFAATFVDDKKYGDCKALSNYMKALLNAVNIRSNYAIIHAGPNEKPVDPAFPYNGFNHAILCVPFKNDTTWLECTSSTQPFGKLGAFTENRTALLITEDGGQMVNTPKSTMQDNQFNSEIHLTLAADGGAKAKLKIAGTGSYRGDYIGVESMSTDDQKQMFMKWLNIRQPRFFDLNPSTDNNGVKEVNIDLEYDKFCDVIAGDKQFYHPTVIDLCAITVPIEEGRKSDFYFTTPLQKSCITIIDLPEGFVVEALPVDQKLKFAYGDYEVKYVYDQGKNQVISTAKFNLTDRIIPAAKYTELQQYLDAVTKAQNKKLVIKHKA